LRARATRTTLSASCGNTDNATTTAVLTSCSADGIERRRRLGFASAFAPPTQMSIVASRIPSYSAPSIACAVTSPNRWTSAAAPGSETPGSRTSTSPGRPPPKTTRNATRSATTITAA
jgi:hypothetical protein